MSYDDVQEIKNLVVNGVPVLVGGRLVNFETGKSELKPGHEKFLKEKVYPVIKAVGPNGWIDIFGYASKAGNAASNLQLSKDRAKALKNNLELWHLWHTKKSLEGMVHIDQGFGEDHPEYYAGQKDNAPHWRAAEVLVFGRKVKVVRPKKKKPELSPTSFEIRLVGGFSVSTWVVQADNYFFQIVDLIRKRTMFFQFTGAGVTASIPKIPGPGSVSKAGPPAKFRTSLPVELFHFNSTAELSQKAGATVGEASIGGTLELDLKDIRNEKKTRVFTNPRELEIEGGSGFQMPGAGSLTRGVFAKASDEFDFNGYQDTWKK